MDDKLQVAKSIRQSIASDVEKRNSLYQSKLKINKALKALLAGASTSAISTGVGAGVSAATFIGAPIAIPLSGAAVLSSVACAAISVVDSINNRRLKRHDRLRLLAYNTQNTLCEVISRFAQDGKIDDIEFNFIAAEFERYKQLVDDIKKGKLTYVKTDIVNQKNEFDESLGRVMRILESRFISD